SMATSVSVTRRTRSSWKPASRASKKAWLPFDGDRRLTNRRVRPTLRQSFNASHSTMESQMANAHRGACFCGAVEIEVSGEPAGMGYCHCQSCRSWSGGPVNAFSLWNPAAVKVTKGASEVATFAKTPASERKYCKKCGGHLMTNHPGLKLVDVFAATIPS